MEWNILKSGKCFGLEWPVWDLVTIRVGRGSEGGEWGAEGKWGREGWGRWRWEGEGSEDVSKGVEDPSYVVEGAECSGGDAGGSRWDDRGEVVEMEGGCDVSTGVIISSKRLEGAATEGKSGCNWDGMRTRELLGEAVTLQEPSGEEWLLAGNLVSSKITLLDR